MPQPLLFQFRTRPGLTGWARILFALGFTIALTIVIAFLALGILLFLVPVLALTGLAYYLLPKAKTRPARSGTARGPVIIDGQFRVVDADERNGNELDDRATGP